MQRTAISTTRSAVAPSSCQTTIAVFGDSQSMNAGTGPFVPSTTRVATQTAMAQWVVDNKTTANIGAFVHVGDFVDDESYTSEYETAYTIYGRLFGVVPGVIVSGNHDEYGTGIDAWNSSVFNSKGSVSGHGLGDLEAHLTSVKDEGKIQNCTLELTLGGHHVMIVGLEWGARDEALTWAKGKIDAHAAAYSDSFVIVVTHAFQWIDGRVYPRPSEGTYTWNPLGYVPIFGDGVNTGVDIKEKLIDLCPNIKLVISGHVVGAHCHASFTRADGSKWVAICQDYQGTEDWNGTVDDRGFIYLLTIDWQNRHIRGRPHSAIGIPWPETRAATDARHNACYFIDVEF